MKKFVSMLAACIMLCTISVLPVSAAEAVPVSDPVGAVSGVISPRASNYFSGSTGTMNALGGQSKIFNMSSGSVPNGAAVSGITVNVTVSSGSSPFYIVVTSPSGDFFEQYVTKSGSVKFTQFNSSFPKGTWKVYIRNTSGVSTATARMTVNYTY